MPITFDDDMPSLEGRIDGVTGLIALDTGNSSTMVVQSVWARKHGLAERLKRGIETVSYGGASRNWASRIATLEIGDTVLKRSIVRYAEDKVGAFSSRTEAANIGTDTLANFVLDFDYGRRDLVYARARVCFATLQPRRPARHQRRARIVSRHAGTARVTCRRGGNRA